MNCIVIIGPDDFEVMSLDGLVRLCRFENKDAPVRADIRLRRASQTETNRLFQSGDGA